MVDVPTANLRILCGCPPDCIKHLIKAGIVKPTETAGVDHETGPNAILLSDLILQNDSFANMAEFPVLQMLYHQGMLIPGHPNNNGIKPLLLGNEQQINAQLNYIYRGNYGLISETEMLEAGASPADAKELMNIKLKFAFGHIANSKELLDTLIISDQAQEIRQAVTIKRIQTNVFELAYQGETVQVDLNLAKGQRYQSPITLESRQIDLEHFAVIHSGEGDGWDTKRSAMSSILMHKGRLYLIDAGPSVMQTLQALGIGLNEIAGLFHTHSHDDHFAGLPDLIRGDRRLKYYATPLVRASVVKKFCALLSIEESEISHYLDFQDLNSNQWNHIDGLEVRPVISPHPVETTIFQFRAPWQGGFKSYSHLADISSFALLNELIEETGSSNQTSFSQMAMDAYIEPADIKKIDIGGGLIHGVATDFKEDHSKKIVLAHTALPLNPEQSQIGSSVPFGAVDVLAATGQDFEYEHANAYLRELHAGISDADIERLLANPIVSFAPGENLLTIGLVQEEMYLILRGYLELRDAHGKATTTFTAGTLAGELSGLLGKPTVYDHIARSYVQALKIPATLYREISIKNNLYPDLKATLEKRLFMFSCWLFEEGISCAALNYLVASLQAVSFKIGHSIDLTSTGDVFLVQQGGVDIYCDELLIQSVGQYQFFGEDAAVGQGRIINRAVVNQDTICYRIDALLLARLPVCRWKLFQIHRKRLLQQ